MLSGETPQSTSRRLTSGDPAVSRRSSSAREREAHDDSGSGRPFCLPAHWHVIQSQEFENVKSPKDASTSQRRGLAAAAGGLGSSSSTCASGGENATGWYMTAAVVVGLQQNAASVRTRYS